ncbi:MAG TPA: PHP domain-containing protein [Actinomycetota bacterium]|nr:PHP domain-containing protein [Actinomycetota bacterium]
MRIDLQAHTTASDGTLSPAEMVAFARDCGVDVLAITDHDTTEGVAEASEAGVGAGVEVVAGIELSCRRGGRPVHMLGLFVDPGSSGISAYTERLRAERAHRANRMVEQLNRLGYAITMEEVLAEAGRGMVGRPHVARALVARGHIPSVSSAFSQGLLGDGGLADVPRRVLDPVEAVSEIAGWGGVAVVAHPGARHPEPVPAPLIVELAEAGLTGVEVEHPDHDRTARKALRKLAAELDLVCTGGSDCHGPHSARPGSYTTDPGQYERLRERALG